MKRRVVLLALTAVVLAGCTKSQDYLDVLQEQRAAWKETADILAGIHDAKSMATAKVALDDKRPQFEAIAKKANALPKPPPPEVEARMKNDYVLERTLKRLQDEVARVRALPGGDAFFKQFDSSQQGLFLSVQP